MVLQDNDVIYSDYLNENVLRLNECVVSCSLY